MHTPPIDMEEVRANVVERMVAKLALRDSLKQAMQQLAAHADRDSLLNPGRRSLKANVNGIIDHIELLQSVVEDDIWPDVQQFAMLFARDVIVETVRQEGGREPIVWLTGNNMAPAWRNFDQIEAIWQADEEGTYVMELWERVENKAGEMNVFIGWPEYDNSLYGVDTSKWEQSEASMKDEPIDNLNDEWSWIDPEPNIQSGFYPADGSPPTLDPEPDTVADEGGYVLTVVSLDVATMITADNVLEWPRGMKIKYKPGVSVIDPQEFYTITEVGRDSDEDVWVKLDNGDPIFDWAEVFVPYE